MNQTTNDPEQNRTVVTRFAPSPTGHLHIGGARTALFCWAFAHRHGGRFLLRIEDTDAQRSSETAGAAILRDLAWLGIGWEDGPGFALPDGSATLGGDERGVGPFHQSERGAIYGSRFDELLEKRLAYPAFETPEELAAMRDAAQREKRTFRYTRRDDYDHDAAMRRVADGEAHVLRLRVDADEIGVRDEVMGEIAFTTEHFDDFVIRKKDGNPTYHFAVVVDDALMGVTHVLRGQEHLNNTPKHVALQGALGLPTPVYAHMPLIFNEKGAKMSKRERDVAAKAACRESEIGGSPAPGVVGDDRFAAWLGDKKAQLEPSEVQAIADALGLDLPEVSVDDFRRAGYLPEVINNYLATLGWSMPGAAREALRTPEGDESDRFDQAFVARHFDLCDIGKSNARFDRQKLLAFNADTIQHAMSDDEFADRWMGWLGEHDPGLLGRLRDAVGAEGASLLARAARPRARTLRDAVDPVAFVLLETDGIEYDQKAAKKAILKGEPSGLDVLPDLRAALAGADEAWARAMSDPGAIEDAVKAFCESRGLGIGKAAQPLRVALTGTAVSPPLGETLALLGRDTVLARIDRCVATFARDASNA